MHIKYSLKSAAPILVGAIFIAQLAGCIFVDHDHGWHHDYPEHHEYEHHDPGIDVRVHGE